MKKRKLSMPTLLLLIYSVIITFFFVAVLFSYANYRYQTKQFALHLYEKAKQNEENWGNVRIAFKKYKEAVNDHLEQTKKDCQKKFLYDGFNFSDSIDNTYQIPKIQAVKKRTEQERYLDQFYVHRKKK
jgi:hypothetical protein